MRILFGCAFGLVSGSVLVLVLVLSRAEPNDLGVNSEIEYSQGARKFLLVSLIGINLAWNFRMFDIGQERAFERIAPNGSWKISKLEIRNSIRILTLESKSSGHVEFIMDAQTKLAKHTGRTTNWGHQKVNALEFCGLFWGHLKLTPNIADRKWRNSTFEKPIDLSFGDCLISIGVVRLVSSVWSLSSNQLESSIYESWSEKRFIRTVSITNRSHDNNNTNSNSNGNNFQMIINEQCTKCTRPNESSGAKRTEIESN